MAAKKRNRSSYETFTPDDVVTLYLSLWELSAAIRRQDMKAIRIAMRKVWAAIPDSPANTGAMRRAINIKRKQGSMPVISIPTFEDLSDAEQIALLMQMWGEE